MSLKLITGQTGEAHITPMQDAMWHRGISGQESCVFDYFNNFSATTEDVYTVRVASGIGMLQGRYFCIEPNDTDSVILGNGTAGYQRIDVICVKISVDQTAGTQSAALAVVQGDPAEEGGDVVAPTVPSGVLDDGDTEAYFPLYYVVLSGTAIQDVSADFTPIGASGDVKTYTKVTLSNSGAKASSAYTGFPYYVDVALDGCTSSHIPYVTAPKSNSLIYKLAATTSGAVRLYVANNTFSTVTIPSITLVKG